MSYRNESSFFYSEVVLSSSNILNLSTSSFDITPAPGSNKIIVALSVKLSYTFGTVAYTPSTFSVGYGPLASLTSVSGMLNQVFDDFAIISGAISPTNTSDINNVSLKVFASVAPLLGDGTLKVGTWYYITNV